MNILILANHFNAGGISSYILNLAGGLALRGHKVYVASGGGEWLDRLKECNIEHIYAPLRTKSIISPKIFFAYPVLQKAVRDKKIEIIHAQTRVTAVLACWLARKHSLPFITTAHGFYRRRIGKRIFPCWGDMVIAISEQVREHLINDFGVSGKKIRLVHNGIDAAHYLSPVTPCQIRDRFGLGDGPVVGIIARLSEVKGHKYLIEAMAEVVKKIPDVQLLSVGDGRIKKGLEKLAHNLDISKNVHFIPAVSDTREAFCVINIFVMPSLQEGLGLSIMEAMASGVPVVASCVGGITSLVRDNETGILVKPKDPCGLAKAIMDLLNDRQKAQYLASNARGLILKDFSQDTMAEETEKVYRECVNLSV